MKQFTDMSFPERAELLHLLFPEEMPALIRFIEGVGKSVMNNLDENRNTWSNPAITFMEWIAIIEITLNKIRKYAEHLHENSRLFADQLFDGLRPMFCVHCLHLYCAQFKQPNRKFSQAVHLFFL